MNDDNKRLSTENLIDTENRVTVLEGNEPEAHSGTFRKKELEDLDDRITVLEGETPEEHNNEMRIKDLLYLDDRVTTLEEAKEEKTITVTVAGIEEGDAPTGTCGDEAITTFPAEIKRIVGTTETLSISCTGYTTAEQEITFDENKSVTVTLEKEQQSDAQL